LPHDARSQSAARGGTRGSDPKKSWIQDEGVAVELAKAGNGEVWGDWFRRFYPSLYRYAYLRLRRRNDAEDIASQVFVEALSGIRAFRYTGRPVLAWLYRIAHNLVSDRIKATERDAARSGPVDPERDREPGPEDAIERIGLLMALAELNPEQREVIVLRYLFSLSAKDTAEVIGKSPAAVFSLQARGLINLRQALESHDEKP
jgi:RNA polymerase sigma-70 factor (ECF subfamily)